MHQETADVDPRRVAAAAVRRHIFLEEGFLFSSLRENGMIVPIMAMLREHGQMSDGMEVLDGMLAQSVDTATGRQRGMPTAFGR